jgi:hypothetical protein
MGRALVLGMALCVCILAGCGSGATSPTSTLPTVGASAVVSPESAAAVDAAMSAAATHLGVTSDMLRVEQVQSREWPDSSLGCPQPGQLYSQVVTPGYLIVITSGTHQLEYHTDERTRVMLCREM